MKNHARFWVVFLLLTASLSACGKPTPSSVVSAFPTSLPLATAGSMMAKSMSSEATSFDLAYNSELTSKERQIIDQFPPIPGGCIGEIAALSLSGVQVIRGTTFTKQFMVKALRNDINGDVYFYATILDGTLFTDLANPSRPDRPFWAPDKALLEPEGLQEDMYVLSFTGIAPDFKGRYVLIYTARTLDRQDCGERIVFAIEFV